MATRTASVSGNWSSTATWGGAAVPVNGDTVVINAGITVLFDVSMSGWAAGIVNLTVNGLLHFRPDIVTELMWSGQISGTGAVVVGNRAITTSWTLTTGQTNVYQVSMSLGVSSVDEGNPLGGSIMFGTTYRVQTSIAAVATTPGSYYYDGSSTLYIHTFDSTTPTAKTITITQPINRPAVNTQLQCTLSYTGSATSAPLATNINIFIYGWMHTLNHTFLNANANSGATTITLLSDLGLQQGDQIVIGANAVLGNLTESTKGLYTVSSYNSTTQNVVLTNPLGTNRATGDVVTIYSRCINFIATNKPTSQYNLSPIINVSQGIYYKNLMPVIDQDFGLNRFITFDSSSPMFYQSNASALRYVTIVNINGSSYIGRWGADLIIKDMVAINLSTSMAFNNQFIIYDSVISNMTPTGLICYFSNNIQFYNTMFMGCNEGLFYASLNIKFYNCLFNSLFGITGQYEMSYLESFNHNQISGNYAVATDGGYVIVDPTVKNGNNPTYQFNFNAPLDIGNNSIWGIHAAQGAVFMDFKFYVPANKPIKIYATFNKNFSFGASDYIQLQIIDPLFDPIFLDELVHNWQGDQFNEFGDGSNPIPSSSPLASISLPDVTNSWEKLVLSYVSPVAKQVIVRVIGQCVSGVCNVDVTGIQKAMAKPPMIVKR